MKTTGKHGKISASEPEIMARWNNKPGGAEQADHKLINNSPAALATHQDCELWLPQLHQFPVSSIREKEKKKDAPCRTHNTSGRDQIKALCLTWTTYHMLEHLLELGVRVICTSFDIVISESITKSFVKLLENLAETNGINLNKVKKL